MIRFLTAIILVALAYALAFGIWVSLLPPIARYRAARPMALSP